MSIDRLINEASEGRLRIALRRAFREAERWQESATPFDGDGDPYHQGVIDATDDIINTIEKELSS